jgi:hypothetical protein
MCEGATAEPIAIISGVLRDLADVIGKRYRLPTNMPDRIRLRWGGGRQCVLLPRATGELNPPLLVAYVWKRMSTQLSTVLKLSFKT